jgi:hypothetical protein
MGQLTKECFDLLENAGNYEERRSTEILIKSANYATGRCTNERSPITRFHSKAGNYFEDSSDRIKAKVSNLAINDIP